YRLPGFGRCSGQYSLFDQDRIVAGDYWRRLCAGGTFCYYSGLLFPSYRRQDLPYESHPPPFRTGRLAGNPGGDKVLDPGDYFGLTGDRDLVSFLKVTGAKG